MKTVHSARAHEDGGESRRRITVKLSVIRGQLLIVIVLGFREAGNGMADPSVGRRGGIRRDRIGFAHDYALYFHLVIGNQVLHGYGVVAITGVCNRIGDSFCYMCDSLCASREDATRE